MRDAYHERNWAVKIIQDEKTRQQEEDAKRDPLEEARLEAERKAEVARKQEEAERERQSKCNQAYLPDEAHPERECATCGDPFFWCECTCKRTSDIPF